MLWAFKVAKSDEKIMGSLSAELKPRKAMENPHVRGVLLHSIKALCLVVATVQPQSHIKFVWTPYYACMHIAFACLCCACYDTCDFRVLYDGVSGGVFR